MWAQRGREGPFKASAVLTALGCVGLGTDGESQHRQLLQDVAPHAVKSAERRCSQSATPGPDPPARGDPGCPLARVPAGLSHREPRPGAVPPVSPWLPHRIPFQGLRNGRGFLMPLLVFPFLSPTSFSDSLSFFLFSLGGALPHLDKMLTAA